MLSRNLISQKATLLISLAIFMKPFAGHLISLPLFPSSQLRLNQFKVKRWPTMGCSWTSGRTEVGTKMDFGDTILIVFRSKLRYANWIGHHRSRLKRNGFRRYCFVSLSVLSAFLWKLRHANYIEQPWKCAKKWIKAQNWVKPWPLRKWWRYESLAFFKPLNTS